MTIQTHPSQHPTQLFERWYAEACGSYGNVRKPLALLTRMVWAMVKLVFRKTYPQLDLHHPDAFTLATATPDGRPSARVLLFKGVEGDGIVFYSNYLSRKGREIERNPQAAMVFHWSFPERQVRVEGLIAKVSAETSDRYWKSRDRESQLSALASHQSAPIGSDSELEAIVESLRAQWRDREIPRPEHWGGYRMDPKRFEFWTGKIHRRHERLEFNRNSQGGWEQRRLQP